MILQRFLLFLGELLCICALISANLFGRGNSNNIINGGDAKAQDTLQHSDNDDTGLKRQITNIDRTHQFSDLSTNQQVSYIRQRPIQDYQVTKLLLASDIEGGLHALNRETGEKLWSIEGEGPLVEISSNFSLYDEPSNTQEEIGFDEQENGSNNRDMLWIVEPYGDGNLYFFNKPLGLNKLPVSISRLVLQSPFALNNDDKIYTGIRKSSLYSIDLTTGEIMQSYGSACKTCDDDSNIDCSNVVMIGKTTYELTIHSKDQLTWNVTYSTWGPNNIDIDLVDQNKYPIDGTYIAPFHDSTILAIDINSKIAKWVSQLPNTVVNVFDILADYNQLSDSNSFIIIPHPLKAPEGFNENENKGTYIDVTDAGSWYAMSSDFYPSLVQSAPASRYSLSERYRTAVHKLHSADELKDSIIGVHSPTEDEDEDLDNLATKETLGHPTNFATNGQIIETRAAQHHTNEYPDYSNPFSPSSRSRSRSSWLGLPSSSNPPLLQIDPSPIKRGFFDTVFGKFLLRCLENLMMLLFFGFIGYVAIRMRWIPSLTTLLKKNGLELKELESVEIKIPEITKANTTDIDSNKADDDDHSLEVDNTNTTESKEKNSSSENHSDNEAHLNEELTQIKPKKEVKIIEPEDKPANGGIKKRKRGSRGGKKSKKQNNDDTRESSESPRNSLSAAGESLAIASTPPNSSMSQNGNGNTGLTLSDSVLGYGSYGTVVFKGTFQNRDVAVKRMLIDFYDVASQEINLLTESDDHPNVIRYFYSETNDRFLYIALELCSASLEDVIEKTNKHQELIGLMEPVNVLKQIANGLHHLHSLKIVHRDIKPQNILVAPPKKLKSKNESSFSPVRILISDFGLCKKLEADESSFKATTQHAAGTSGWRAPELLLENINVGNSTNSDHSFSTSTNNSLSEALAFDFLTNRKLTRAIDIFSLGCCFYYILTNGGHPFGDRYLREGNVIKNIYSLDLLDILPENVEESRNLIEKMIARNPKSRPSTDQVLNHPFFWSNAKKLEFLLKVSDRFEVERRDPPSDLLIELESVAENVIGGDWDAKFEKLFLNNLGKYRKYHGDRLMDLLRALRNKYHHFNDMPPELAVKMSPLPDGFYQYFNRKFPNLLMEIYGVVEEHLKDDHVLGNFF